MPVERRPDFKQALSTLRQLKEKEEEAQRNQRWTQIMYEWVTLHDTNVNAWHFTMRTLATTSTERRAHFLGSVVVSSSSHTCTLAQDVCAIHLIHMVIHVCVVSSP